MTQVGDYLCNLDPVSEFLASGGIYTRDLDCRKRVSESSTIMQ